jgi:hypothetical protein
MPGQPTDGGAVPDIDGTLWEIKQTLDQLGFDVSHGKYPARMLRDVKAAVDELRRALWSVLETDNSGKAKQVRDARSGFRRKLAAFRMKRLERMLTDVRMDLAKGVVAGNDSELKTLTSSLQATLKSITRLTHGKG